MAPTRTKSARSSPQSSPQSSPSKLARPRKIKWYLDQHGHMCQSRQSSTTLIRRRPKGVDATDIQYHIFSADMLTELVTYLPQCLEFAMVDFQSLQSTGEIFYSVEYYTRMFSNLDEASEAWERSRGSVRSRIMLATWDTDHALSFGVGA
ncbi:hypothetical protein B0H14DRAFT_2604633 [Mycena olivaceomarginata]|nr:hypothetical protein B0H14DRAFT_2604633 [Mycena olivaceomarginata]